MKKSVFKTGASGMLGKLIVEKLEILGSAQIKYQWRGEFYKGVDSEFLK